MRDCFDIRSGLSFSSSQLVIATSLNFSASFFVVHQPALLVFTLKVSSGEISSGSNFSFSLTSVTGACSVNSRSLTAYTTDSSGAFLDLSTNASLTSKCNRPTIQEFILASVNGTVNILTGTYRGRCNCNNSITVHAPRRPAGTKTSCQCHCSTSWRIHYH